MARRPSVIKRKPKKIKGSAQLTKSVNGKYLGHSEPDFKLGVPMTAVEYGNALTWYHSMEPQRAKDYLHVYLIAAKRHEEANAVLRVPDKWVNPTIAFTARLMFRGARVPASAEFFNKNLTAMLRHVGEAVDDVEEGNEENTDTPIVKSRAQEKSSAFLAEFEGMIDDGLPPGFSMTSHLQKSGATPIVAKAVAQKYSGPAQELQEALEGADPQLVEGYSSYPRRTLLGLATLFQSFVDDALAFASNVVKAKAPRRKKAQSVEKKLKFIVNSYQKNSSEFNLVSVDPARIIGSTELWTVNTKYKLLTVFRAKEGCTLDVERCKIVNFDEVRSASKRIGRKAAEYIKRVMNNPKSALRKLMDEIAGEPLKLQERINENTVLLRA